MGCANGNVCILNAIIAKLGTLLNTETNVMIFVTSVFSTVTFSHCLLKRFAVLSTFCLLCQQIFSNILLVRDDFFFFGRRIKSGPNGRSYEHAN